ncbi:MAG: hypothetical protein C4293_13330 [Nitrospiraceae bacterium]
MKNFSMLLVHFILLPSLSLAGEIRGMITEGGKSVGPGIRVEVRCGEKTYPSTTDKFGSYRLFVPEKGTCTVQVTYQNQAPSRAIESFEDSVRYDLVIEKQGGQYVLRRK